MTQGTLVLMGRRPEEFPALELHAAEFGWRVSTAATWAELRGAGVVVFDARAIGCSWEDALKRIGAIAPQAFPIVCHGFSDVIDWPMLADLGAFHAVRHPLDAGEIRRSLGFVQAAVSRRSCLRLAAHAA